MPDLDTHTLDALGPDTIRAFYCGERRVRDRAHAEVKWRASGDPSMPDVRVLTGYPAVFGQETTLYEGKGFVIRELVHAGFFDGVLTDDCHLNYAHESVSAMCRNGIVGPGGMELSVDDHGLRVHALVPMDDLDAQRLAPKMDRGVVDQMSFAFTVAEETCDQTVDENDRDVYTYTLLLCGRLYDVCVCPLGAYSQTEAMLRTFAAQLDGRSPEGRPSVPSRSNEGSEGDEARADAGLLHKRTLLRVHSAAACHPFTEREASNA